MNINEKLSIRRKELGLTLEEVGKIVGVSKSTVKKWESGYIESMRSDKITLLAKALQVPPGFIGGWDKFDEKFNKDGKLAKEVKVIENLPKLSAKDEREVAKSLEAILNDYDHQNSLAAFNESDDQEDRELLRASLENTMRLAKQMAKKKFTPKKHRK